MGPHRMGGAGIPLPNVAFLAQQCPQAGRNERSARLHVPLSSVNASGTTVPLGQSGAYAFCYSAAMSAKEGQRNPSRRPECEAVERLLVAAEEQLREEQLDLFSVDRVVGRAGASVGTFYRRFPSKQALLCAVLDRLHARLQPAILEALETQEHVEQSLEEAVDHAFDVLIERVLSERQLSRAFMLLAGFDPVLREKVKEMNIERREAVTAVLAAHRAEIAHPDPDMAIHQAYHMYLSTMNGRLTFFAPNNIPSIGVSDEFIFAQLKVAIGNFLRGNGGGSESAGEAPATD
jgi:AcrR family transcriptional regulator